jgi:hypothetical protein
LYEPFDFFLDVDTWYTRHPRDDERFFAALRKVVNKEEFDPDAMREYMARKLNVSRNDEHLNSALDHYRAAAFAVKTYLQTP